jgi:hypothetical protein
MANSVSPFVGSDNPNFTRQFNIETVGGDQRQRLAEMLRSNALNMPQGQMVSGWYVAPSWSQNLAQLANTAVGVLGGAQIDKEKQEALQHDLDLMSGQPTPQKLAAAIRPTTTPLPEGDLTPQQVTGLNAPQQQMQPQITAQGGIPDFRQFKSPEIRNMMMKRQIDALNPEFSQTVQYDQQNRAFVLDKRGNMKYLGTDETPVRKADLNELIQIDPRTGQPVRNELLFNTKRDISRAGASNVSVNTGQKGFDNTLKLRGDFRSEPVYKGFQEVQAAWDQVRETSKNATPANDLATATKMMKILDPNSVVRESELALALAATGLEDRITNYVNMLRTGQKLNPAQRKDFSGMAETLYNEAAKRYNQKRNEYATIADRNQLNVDDVVGKPAQFQKKVLRRGKLGDKTVVEYDDGTIEYVK